MKQGPGEKNSAVNPPSLQWRLQNNSSIRLSNPNLLGAGKKDKEARWVIFTSLNFKLLAWEMPTLSMKHSKRNEKMSEAQIFESHKIIPACDRVWECKPTRAERRNRKRRPFWTAMPKWIIGMQCVACSDTPHHGRRRATLWFLKWKFGPAKVGFIGPAGNSPAGIPHSRRQAQLHDICFLK